jgi:hypothetical protein
MASVVIRSPAIDARRRRRRRPQERKYKKLKEEIIQEVNYDGGANHAGGENLAFGAP